MVQGLSWPEDRGDWLPLVAGRPLRQAHYELIADRSLRLELGEKVKLGKAVYEVVGLTSGMVGSGGDGLGFFSVSDAESIQFDQPGEANRLERQARRARAEAQDIGRVQPELLERAVGPASGIPALAPPQVSAVMLTIQPGMSAAKAAETISTWPDVTVYSKQQQVDLLLSGMVDKARRQLGLFRVLLIIISTIIMALIIYTLTLDKIHDIAMLKLMGARNGVIIVVRNSIILVDFIEQRLREGTPLAEAVIDAGAVRFRPMLLTALAVVEGAAVILADPIFQGLAIALMAGEIASLLISRMAVPVLYFMAHAPRRRTDPPPAAD